MNPPFEPGKWYRTQGGWRAMYVGANSEGDAVFDHTSDHTGVYTHKNDGFYYKHSNFNIVAPWIDKPVVDWSKERDWVKAIAMDADGRWHRFSEIPKPSPLQAHWYKHVSEYRQQMHPTEYPTNPDGSPWTGDWKDSLITRP